jgi:hypothetical protein
MHNSDHMSNERERENPQLLPSIIYHPITHNMSKQYLIYSQPMHLGTKN